MVISKKDKAFILLIISSIIVLWFLISLFSYLLSVTLAKNSGTFDQISKVDEKNWYNVSRPLTNEDLKKRVVILDFWTYSCVKCLQNLPEIKELEKKFGDKILIIGVHSGKFSSERSPNAIKDAIAKYNITHPIINDSDLKIWKSFKVKSWPTVIIISPSGRVRKIYDDVIDAEKISNRVSGLLRQHRFMLNNKRLPILLENNKIASNILNFPSKIEYVKNFKDKNNEVSALIISNSMDNNIIVTSIKGRIITKIGSKKAGLVDGNFSEAEFNNPVGLLYQNQILYVADRGNNAIRKVDFTNNTVSTIIGSGPRGEALEKEKDADEVHLSSPQDLAFFPDEKHITIANTGTNQLLTYDIEKGKIKPFAGSGERDLIDGKYLSNALAQPSGLSVFEDELYFVDAYSSSLRSVDKEGNVKTLIGSGLDKFGNRNGPKDQGSMQNPLGLFADNSGIYIADSYNQLVRKYDYNSKSITTYSGNGSKGNDAGEITSYNEVTDVVVTAENVYIVDSNNNRIIVKNKSSGKAAILDIIPPLELPQDGLLEYLPNLETLKDSEVVSDQNIDLNISFRKGWKLNEMAPSFFNLVEVLNFKEANLIASYDWNMVKAGKIKLPKMSHKHKYYLQGTIYYCENKKNALCFVNSYESKIIPSKSSEVKSIDILL